VADGRITKREHRGMMLYYFPEHRVGQRSSTLEEDILNREMQIDLGDHMAIASALEDYPVPRQSNGVGFASLMDEASRFCFCFMFALLACLLFSRLQEQV